MRVLVPIYNNELFIREVIKSYTSLCEVGTSFENFWMTKGDYEIIHLHWPEYLFKWQVPTDLELILLERILKEWSAKGAKIVITRHNYLPHQPNPEQFEQLYQTTYTHADAIIHLGQFSIQEYQDRYKFSFNKNQTHAYIPHPIFTQYPNAVSRIEARKKLNIGKDTVVMLVFGEVRKASEKNLILKSFDVLEAKDKLLIVPRWKFSLEKEPVNRLKWFKIMNSKRYRLFDEFVRDDEVQYYFNASDFVFLPRLDTLNSGVPFLAAVFSKPVVGVGTGNVGEFLQAINMPTFSELDEGSLAKALKNVMDIHEAEKYYASITKSHSSSEIGDKHFQFFKQISSTKRPNVNTIGHNLCNHTRL